MDEGCTRTSDAEERESGRVQHVDRPSNPAEERVGKDGDDTGAAGDGKVTPVTDGGGRNADQQVADDTAGEADNDGDHDDAKEVDSSRRSSSLAGRFDRLPAFDQPTRTPSMDTEPPSNPSTGKVTGSSRRRCASTYRSGR